MPRPRRRHDTYGRIVHQLTGRLEDRASETPACPGPTVNPHGAARLSVRHALGNQPREPVLLFRQPTTRASSPTLSHRNLRLRSCCDVDWNSPRHDGANSGQPVMAMRAGSNHERSIDQLGGERPRHAAGAALAKGLNDQEKRSGIPAPSLDRHRFGTARHPPRRPVDRSPAPGIDQAPQMPCGAIRS
jgi:hypothetical protein